LIGEVVQSLYGLLFEQTSPSIPVAIDCNPPKTLQTFSVTSCTVTCGSL
jgi:hypothetical protein